MAGDGVILCFRSPVADASSQIVRSYRGDATIRDVRDDLATVCDCDASTLKLIFAGKIWNDASQTIVAALGSMYKPQDPEFRYIVMLLGGSGGLRFKPEFVSAIARPTLTHSQSEAAAASPRSPPVSALAPVTAVTNGASPHAGTLSPELRRATSDSYERTFLAESARRRLQAPGANAPEIAQSPPSATSADAGAQTPQRAAGLPVDSVQASPAPATPAETPRSPVAAPTGAQGLAGAPTAGALQPTAAAPSPSMAVPVPAAVAVPAPPVWAAATAPQAAALAHALAAAQAASAAAAACMTPLGIQMGMGLPGFTYGMLPASPSLQAFTLGTGVGMGTASPMMSPTMGLVPGPIIPPMAPLDMPPAAVGVRNYPASPLDATAQALSWHSAGYGAHPTGAAAAVTAPMTAGTPLLHPQLRRVVSGADATPVLAPGTPVPAHGVTAALGVPPHPASPQVAPISPMLAAVMHQQATLAHHINALQTAQHQLLAAHAGSPLVGAGNTFGALPPAFSLGDGVLSDTSGVDGLRRRRPSRTTRSARASDARDTPDRSRTSERRSRRRSASPRAADTAAEPVQQAAQEPRRDAPGAAAAAGADQAAQGAVAGPPAPGLRRFVNVGLIIRLVVFGALFFHGASQERMMLVACVLVGVYLAQVGLIPDVWTMCRRRQNAAPQPAARPAQAAGGVGNPPPEQGAGQGRPAVAAPARHQPNHPLSALLLMAHGSYLMDAFALLASFVISLIPTWMPDQELLGRAF